MSLTKIKSVDAHSPAQRAGVRPGETLTHINGRPIVDVLDYKFFAYDPRLELTLVGGDGRSRTLRVRKAEGEELGLNFETYLMDKARSCANRCIFCFVDQMPPGMRETLYFKDDDARLSFLMGNYITLTNLSEREIARIAELRISPINISVHATDPALREAMLKHRRAGECLAIMERFAAAGITMNCQIVACPGVNDGPALEHTLREFWSLGEGLLSVACVPVGLTRYREGLYPLEPYNQKTAGEVLDLLEQWGNKWKEERGARTVYASDELYLLAGRPIPPLEFYEDFPQIENGVGMLRNLQDEFDWALEDLELPDSPRHVTIPTGECGFRFLDQLLDGLRQKCHNITIDLIPVKNDFFGGTVNVTGLLTGQDILKNLKGRDLGDEVLLATNMMRAGEDVFLDDMTREDLSASLGVPCRRVGSTGEALVCAICGLPQPDTPGFNPYEGSWEHR